MGGSARDAREQEPGEDRTRGRGDERWADGLSFDPSLSDAPFNLLTETTWGGWGRLRVCLLAPGGGVSLAYVRLSAAQPSTLG